ncbi:hypothetical protein [Clostridium sp. CCUG 7971]|uniref:hypothetical protein n=1 Tax=Clostridium sp. CCUG 7971 TaxID=2811414 RepID=UPI001ABB6F7B|nr:hypothetical protein [Clostridium sp. CCUG 7971]MBO3445754.1 hypothetical protein [Clostridium sp. CCUG 7971]
MKKIKVVAGVAILSIGVFAYSNIDLKKGNAEDDIEAKVESINKENTDDSLKESVDEIKDKISEKSKKAQDIDLDIKELTSSYDENKLDRAQEILEKINKKDLSEEQKNKVNDIENKINDSTKLAEKSMNKVNSKIDNAKDKLTKADSVIKSLKNKIDTASDAINNVTGKLEKITEKQK